jgi:hypothetical protein
MRKRSLILSLIVVFVAFVLICLLVLFVNPRHEPHPRSAQRRADIQMILNAIDRYQKVHNKELPADIPMDAPREICAIGSVDCTGYVDLSQLATSFSYQPRDPFLLFLNPASNGMGYFVVKDPISSRLTISAPLQEQDMAGYTEQPPDIQMTQ